MQRKIGMSGNGDLYENVFGREKYLCHYTSFDSLCSIISSMTLRVCSFARSNDIAELESNISCILDTEKKSNIERYIEEKCGYISFSKNKVFEGEKPIPRYGYLIPNMWGIYADKSQGACLVLDEDALIKENVGALNSAEWYSFQDVEYRKFQNLKLTSSKDSIEDTIRGLCTHILGTKHDSWESEQERRLVGVGLPSVLSLKGNAIIGIVIGKRTVSNHRERLLSILGNAQNSCYGILKKDIFVKQEILGNNVFTTGFGTYFDIN